MKAVKFFSLFFILAYNILVPTHLFCCCTPGIRSSAEQEIQHPCCQNDKNGINGEFSKAKLSQEIRSCACDVRADIPEKEKIFIPVYLHQILQGYEDFFQISFLNTKDDEYYLASQMSPPWSAFLLSNPRNAGLLCIAAVVLRC